MLYFVFYYLILVIKKNSRTQEIIINWKPTDLVWHNNTHISPNSWLCVIKNLIYLHFEHASCTVNVFGTRDFMFIGTWDDKKFYIRMTTVSGDAHFMLLNLRGCTMYDHVYTMYDCAFMTCASKDRGKCVYFDDMHSLV